MTPIVVPCLADAIGNILHTRVKTGSLSNGAFVQTVDFGVE